MNSQFLYTYILVFMCQKEDIEFLHQYEVHIAFYEKKNSR